MGNVYGIANPTPSNAGIGAPVDVACPAGSDTVVLTSQPLAANAPGDFYPAIFALLTILLGATPPTALAARFNLNGGSAVTVQTVPVPLLVASATLYLPVIFFGLNSGTAWVGAGSFVNLTLNPTGQPVTLKAPTSLMFVQLFRGPDAQDQSVHTKIHGRRLMGGAASIAALAANYNSIALYNDSTIGHLLRVDNWMASVGAGTAVAFFQPGALTTLIARGISLFSGEQAQAGSIYSQQDINPPPFGVFINTGGQATQSPELTPWFYLRPGYSLVFKTFAVNLVLTVSFWWEDLTMDMLEDNELDQPVSKHRRPHGQYVRATADWFGGERMAGHGHQTAVTAQRSLVSLYNDAIDGSNLFVIGCTGLTGTTGSIIDVTVHPGFLGTLVPNATGAVGPFFRVFAGKIYTGSNVGNTADPVIWLFTSSLDGNVPWPYEYPLCMLPPGYSLLLQTEQDSQDLRAVFQWLVMGANQGYY